MRICAKLSSIMQMQFTTVDTKKRRSLNFRAGDMVRVWVKIEEKGKTRFQAFEGLVIARKHGNEEGATFTVRKVSGGIGVERIFPLYSPNIDKIETVRRAKVRRSKLYYVREKAAREIRRKMKQVKAVIIKDNLETKRQEEKAQREEAALQLDSLDNTRDESGQATKEEVKEEKTEEIEKVV